MPPIESIEPVNESQESAGHDADSTNIGSEGQEATKGGEAKPEYMSREQFDEAVSGLAEQMNERFGGSIKELTDGFRYLYQLVNEKSEGKQKEQPIIPDADKLAEMDVPQLRGIFAGLQDMFEKKLSEIGNEVKSLRQEREQEAKTTGYYSQLTEQLSKAVDMFPTLRDDDMRAIFIDRLSNRIQAANWDMSKVNMMKLAKEFDTVYGRKLKAAQLGQKAAVNPFVRRGVGGTGSVPGLKKPEIKDMKSFHKAQDEFLDQFADAIIAEKFGVES